MLLGVAEGVTLGVEAVEAKPTRGVERPFGARPAEASEGARRGVTGVFAVRVDDVDSFGFFVFIFDPMVGSNGVRRVRWKAGRRIWGGGHDRRWRVDGCSGEVICLPKTDVQLQNKPWREEGATGLCEVVNV